MRSAVARLMSPDEVRRAALRAYLAQARTCLGLAARRLNDGDDGGMVTAFEEFASSAKASAVLLMAIEPTADKRLAIATGAGRTHSAKTCFVQVWADGSVDVTIIEGNGGYIDLHRVKRPVAVRRATYWLTCGADVVWDRESPKVRL